ncbi:hypothetical protein EXU48_00215 [Occultella glacieicola]|uniref:Cardiolipin synthase N-terminal domain-containing protein n=1 Tax=Occultella glacieicola TaxID=2518684 RepID=A0ABY2E842_9MICO|nr:PLD nuclease N-terminal domain-containing protein [Occultella glacieicola]TDE98681.1 hypothetical protein EXU48_00215 [Occultella glacieicola]
MERDGRKKIDWNDFTAGQKVAIIGVGAVELGLLVAALVDLKRRPAELVRGPKAAWVAASFVNFVGPVSYFAFGRKH